MAKAYIFDLDGTLVDVEPLYVLAVQQAIVAKGGDELPYDEVSDIVFGRSWSATYEGVQEKQPGLFDDIDTLINMTITIHKRLIGENDIIIPESVTLLKTLADKAPVTIVSGSTRQQIKDMAALMGVSDNLTFYLGAEDYHPGKPDPACFLMAADKLGVDPKDCVVFEDSNAGVKAAKAAGMYCVALKQENAPEQDISMADEIHNSLGNYQI